MKKRLLTFWVELMLKKEFRLEEKLEKIRKKRWEIIDRINKA